MRTKGLILLSVLLGSLLLGLNVALNVAADDCGGDGKDGNCNSVQTKNGNGQCAKWYDKQKVPTGDNLTWDIATGDELVYNFDVDMGYTMDSNVWEDLSAVVKKQLNLTTFNAKALVDGMIALLPNGQQIKLTIGELTSDNITESYMYEDSQYSGYYCNPSPPYDCHDKYTQSRCNVTRNYNMDTIYASLLAKNSTGDWVDPMLVALEYMRAGMKVMYDNGLWQILPQIDEGQPLNPNNDTQWEFIKNFVLSENISMSNLPISSYIWDDDSWNVTTYYNCSSLNDTCAGPCWGVCDENENCTACSGYWSNCSGDCSWIKCSPECQACDSCKQGCLDNDTCWIADPVVYNQTYGFLPTGDSPRLGPGDKNTGDYVGPAFVFVNNEPAPSFIVLPAYWSWADWYNFGEAIYAMHPPSAICDSSGMTCPGGVCSCIGSTLVSFPTSLLGMVNFTGMTGFTHDNKSAQLSWFFDDMNSQLKNWLIPEVLKFGFQNLGGAAGLSIKYDSKGAIEHIVIYIDAKATVDLTGEQYKDVDFGGLAVKNERVTFNIALKLWQNGTTIPSKSDLGMKAIPWEPIVDVPSGWTDPDKAAIVELGTGAGQKATVSASSELSMELTIDTTGPVLIDMAIWDDNPTGSKVGFEDDNKALYFYIEANDTSNITFPIKVKINLPEGATEKGDASQIASILKLVTWENNTWVPLEDITFTVDLAAGTVELSIPHLSVFGLGVEPQLDVSISGFSMVVTVFVMLGTVGLIAGKKFRR